MKKTLSVILLFTLLIGLLSGCGASAPAAQSDRLQIVTTIFPVYDWVRQILGDQAENADVTMLLDNGVDLHSYQPTATDIAKISTCDLFIYVGGESDKWVDNALDQATNKDMLVINLLDVLGDQVKEEELVEGMQEEAHDHDEEEHAEDHDHDEDEHDHEEGEEHHHEHEEGEVEYDEHVWLSLKNAGVLCESICESLCEADKENADRFKANCSAYVEQLKALDADFQTAVEESSVDTLVFGDRFPFRYLVDDYGLNYYAAFVGCSAESEASFETVIFLAGKLDELGLKSILQIETADGSLASTIRDATKTKDQQILTLNSLQSVTAAQSAEGVTYLDVMKENLNVLREALK